MLCIEWRDGVVFSRHLFEEEKPDKITYLIFLNSGLSSSIFYLGFEWIN